MTYAPSIAPSLRASFPGVSVDPSIVRSASLVQESMCHDILSLKVAAGPSYAVLAQGAPVHFTWGNERGQGEFYGYVHRVGSTHRSSARTSEIVCLGASYPLLMGGVQVWVGMTASDVVRDIARIFRMGVDVEDHPLVHTQISQAGESYWQVMVRLAEQIGYVLRMDGITIVFRSRDSMIKHHRPMSPEFVFNPDRRAKAPVMSFTPKVGAFSPDHGAHRFSASLGIDAVSGTVLESHSGTPYAGLAPVNQGHVVSRATGHALESETATSAARENSRFMQAARMVSLGDALVEPETFARVLGTEMSGLWMVRKVEHEISESNYTLVADLVAEDLGASHLLPGEVRREAGTAPQINPHRPGALQAHPRPVLVDKRSVIGAAGTPLGDVYWSSPVINWRS